ncbi:MAG: hypothetical protein LBF80_04345 [Spirochaetaceae bacterium]|jgi:hypothetical protein|nr:hypothetical protein [Spirochaetaceae bacterium]
MDDEFTRCEAVLNAELDALVEVGAAQDFVNEAVRGRNWVDFDASIKTINGIASRVAGLEEERTALMRGAGAHGFYDFARRFPDEERSILCGLYRQVRLEAARTRFSAEALASYLGEARALVSGLLEAAFPEKRGKIYGRSGMERDAKMGGVVLDRRF